MSTTTQFDLPIVQKAYEEFQNIIILDRPGIGITRKAVVLFSSNGLYFPNTDVEAQRVLVDQDRFEWHRTLPEGYERVVLVRDVYKTWYLKGISPQLADPRSLAEFLRRKLAGWDIQMAGVSSGGFAAVLFGCLVGARRVFSLAGQFNLELLLHDPQERVLNPWVARASCDPTLTTFLDLRRQFHAEMPEIFYVAPMNSPVDQAHINIARSDPRIRVLLVNSDQHDSNLLRPALRRMFSRPSTYLENLTRNTPLHGWDRVELSRRIAGNRRHFTYLFSHRRDLLRQ